MSFKPLSREEERETLIEVCNIEREEPSRQREEPVQGSTPKEVRRERHQRGEGQGSAIRMEELGSYKAS